MTTQIEAGGYIIHKGWSDYSVAQVEKVTEKQVKVRDHWRGRTLRKAEVVAFRSDKAAADLLCQAINGAHGTLNQRIRKADEEYRSRVRAARESFDAALAQLVERSTHA